MLKRWGLLAAMVAAVVGCTPKPPADEGIKADGPSHASGSKPTPTMPLASSSAQPPELERARLLLVPAASDGDALSTIRTARLQAKADGRVLVVFVSATWCAPCKKLKEEIATGRLDARYATTTLLAFDADRDAERLLAAGYSFKFVPYVALPAADGHPADSQQATGSGSGAWRELLGKLDAWQAAGPK